MQKLQFYTNYLNKVKEPCNINVKYYLQERLNNAVRNIEMIILQQLN